MLFKSDCLLEFQEQNLKKSRQIFCGNEESRWKTICLKPLQKPFPWCTLLAKRGVLKIQTTSEQFSIFTQNSLKYSRHTKFFDLACVTVTQIDRSCRKLSDANLCQRCHLTSKVYLNLRIILDSVTWVNEVP